MDGKIIRRTAIGAATALCLTSAPVALTAVGLPAAQAAQASTALTGPQAKAAIIATSRATTAKLLRTGGRLAYSQAHQEDGYVQDRNLITVDAVRDTARSIYSGASSGDENPDYWNEPCEQVGWGNQVVVKDRAGTWYKFRPSKYKVEKRSLSLLGRSPKSTTWNNIPNAKASQREFIDRHGLERDFQDLGLWSLLRMQFDASTRTATTTGATYAINYRDGDNGHPGRITLSADNDGALTWLSEQTDLVDPSAGWKRSWSATYSAQNVAVPTKKSTVRTSALRGACTALAIKDEVRALARSVAAEVNDRGRAYTERIRLEARHQLRSSWLPIRVKNVKGGVRITGKHKRLKTTPTWTVTARNGKAIARKVR